MPWRGAEVPGEFPSLGYLVADWIEAHCVIPDREQAGEPYLLTNEMVRFLLFFYRLDPQTGRFVYDRGGQIVRPQKWGKGPFSAAIICAEAEGPVLFDGWDAQGEPVGKSWATPLIQVTACSEEQTDNTWRALLPMIERGDLKADIPDTGETRINLPGGGRIEPVTSAARSRLGNPISFVLQDETHAWFQKNGGRRLADNQRRNVAGMGGRWLETTNAWDPAEESVAQQTFEGQEPGVFRDMVEPGPGSIRNKRERRKMLRRVYGDSVKTPDGGWVELDRIESEIEALLPRDPAQAERFFLNRVRAAEDAAFDLDRWAELAEVKTVPDKSLITLGVKGSRFGDSVAIIATDLETGHQWPVGVWDVPEGQEDYEHDANEIDGAMNEVFDGYEVWRAYVDPQNIGLLLDRWQGRWGEKRIVPWDTQRPKQMAHICRNYQAAMHGGEVSHDGFESFSAHISNAKRRPVSVLDEDRRPMWVIGKDRPGSPRPIAAAVAGCLSWEARSDAIAAGVTKRRTRVAGF